MRFAILFSSLLLMLLPAAAQGASTPIKPNASNTATASLFGFSVPIGGDSIIVGTPNDDKPGSSGNGSVYVIDNINAWCPPDLRQDGFIDGADLGLILGNWGHPETSDFNLDGYTDVADLGELLSQWGLCPAP
jgi:FG-GAP repeat protein